MTNKSNRLIKEKSPYLLQHAHNPVDWYPWGEEAFEKAKKEDKPIFLSIGYSTCHWCHVMEKESFDNPDVATLLNDAFICIKVDREERPDIDGTYMTVCQAMTGSGGWPLTIIITPDKKPFFAGTYFPSNSRFGQPGLLQLIPHIKDTWKKNKEILLRSSDAILELMEEHYEKGEITDELVKKTYEQLLQRFDEVYGGFYGAPKFPTPHNLFFLLRYWKRTGEKKALAMVEKTLQEMCHGGIYDHLGFGFHRYSTDAQWMVPHFEKMLYDQALIALAYTEAYQVTHKDEYKRVAQEIFSYVMQTMTSPEGGFYSAEDADSEGEEGTFYVWTEKEITELLKNEAVKFFTVYGLEKCDGRYVLYRKMEERCDDERKILFARREKRVYPFKDDKILTDWNGLMIAALAKGAAVFGEPIYAKAAEHAAMFILTKLRLNSKLLHRYRRGEAAIPAYLDDYAFFIWGLFELYEATFNVYYLKNALELNNELLNHFWDKKDGGFSTTSDDAEIILQKRKEYYDGALPSGNAVAMLNLLRFAQITGDLIYEEKARKLGQAFPIHQAPSAHTFFMTAIDFLLNPSFVTVTANKEIIAMLRTHFLPSMVILHPDPALASITPLVKGKDNEKMAYICRHGTCLLPTSDIKRILEHLQT